MGILEVKKIITEYLIHAPEQSDWPWEDHCDGLAGGILTQLKLNGYELHKDYASVSLDVDGADTPPLIDKE